MIVREAIRNDIPAIARVHVDTWRTTYRGIVPDEILANLSYEKRENGWHQVLNNAAKDSNFTYVAESQSGKIVGFANGEVERAGDPVYRGELNAIYVLKSHQQQGIGRELVRVVAQKLSQTEIHSMLVWVLAQNPACRFYETLGGQKVYEKEIERGGANLIEIAYGWMDTVNLKHHSAT
ncbi:GNAT family N-acetyltransferase [cf. Phormidesmis sp. LEGE 11477]|uniref:GNAT family N-acetyltransferase n=1 Tax=cf. Phormidesmis sp. LEGE 11477 TaxID=1828680 RepID=UPI001880BC89|nr:GNAT family N-acetyltransferase [cf. Phormidesmis sp. LEGE 11477]MBE9059507.1 GNAT family N-acetyltransferase [cf. Phormidesmis sp. LEGE 11477]